MTPGNVEFLRLERSALLCGLGFTQKVLKASTTGRQIIKIQVGFELNWAGSSGAQYRNHLPAMTAIDVEVGIRSEYQRIGHCLGHAHQAGVSKTHRYACVFLQERYHGLHVVVQIEPRNHGSPRKHRVQSRRAPFAKQMVGFRQQRLARIPRRRIFRRLLDGPFMVGVTAAKHRHEKTSINQHASCHSPWFSSISSFSRSCRLASRPPSRSGRR